jgi:hypothetical protein
LVTDVVSNVGNYLTNVESSTADFVAKEVEKATVI